MNIGMCVFDSRLPQKYSTSLMSNGLPKNHLNVGDAFKDFFPHTYANYT